MKLIKCEHCKHIASEEFLQEIRNIVEDCSQYESSAKAAGLTAFVILTMLDGSGEYGGNQYRVVTEDGELVEFGHHELGLHIFGEEGK